MGNDFAAAQELLRNAKPARGKFSASGFCRALVGLVLNMVNERAEFGFHTPPCMSIQRKEFRVQPDTGHTVTHRAYSYSCTPAGAIPVHLVSSNRVSLLSGRTATPGPCLYRLIHPGWTGQKATELRNGSASVSRESASPDGPVGLCAVAMGSHGRTGPE
ncbi:uncharacterized protein N7515_008998 [Penicillium bovifimosum]|uniref:Uncharacterized protein n=1 Tax=Penicillium bovifimosum TaxID=126998 RepID=A0A9W9GIF5_9EURO|nr:uncharacterized protein N7515_008998 [Penicillium bovifimosum]KAJ5121037.1 hypothetical protein N7515_008998 [Penicillium bovifimosum]